MRKGRELADGRSGTIHTNVSRSATAPEYQRSRTMHAVRPRSVSHAQFPGSRDTACNISGALPSVEGTCVHHLQCGHAIIAGERDCGTNCLTARNWDGDRALPFACSECIQYCIEDLYRDCGNWMRSLVKEKRTTKGMQGELRRKAQTHKMEDIQKMMECRRCLPVGRSTGEWLVWKPTWKVPKIGSFWQELAVQINAEDSLKRVRQLFAILEIRTIDLSTGGESGALTDVATLINTMDTVKVKSEEDTEMEMDTNMDIDVLLARITEMTLGGDQDHPIVID